MGADTGGRSKAAERDEHAALFAWVAACRGQCPALGLVLHVPNEGRRAPWVAARDGIRAGVPDVLVLMPAHGLAGLAIELKGAAGRLTEAQRGWLARLDAAGWLALVAHFRLPGDWIAAAGTIAQYVGRPDLVPDGWREREGDVILRPPWGPSRAAGGLT